MRRRFRAIKASLAVFALVVAVAACAGTIGGQGDPAAPVLIAGKVLDAGGNPIGGATLQVVVNDYGAAPNVGDRVPQVFQASFTANVDGTFSIHLAPTPELIAFASKEGGFVNFNLYAVGPNSALITPWAFPRQLENGTWADAVPSVELRPLTR
jgi:hypothetical protein